MAKGRKVFDMDATQLRKFEKGDQITTGNPFPGLAMDEEIVWTATNAIEGTRDCAKLGPRKFKVVEFDLTYLGILMGKIRATELDKNKIEWRAIT